MKCVDFGKDSLTEKEKNKLKEELRVFQMLCHPYICLSRQSWFTKIG